MFSDKNVHIWTFKLPLPWMSPSFPGKIHNQSIKMSVNAHTHSSKTCSHFFYSFYCPWKLGLGPKLYSLLSIILRYKIYHKVTKAKKESRNTLYLKTINILINFKVDRKNLIRAVALRKVAWSWPIHLINLCCKIC